MHNIKKQVFCTIKLYLFVLKIIKNEKINKYLIVIYEAHIDFKIYQFFFFFIE